MFFACCFIIACVMMHDANTMESLKQKEKLHMPGSKKYILAGGPCSGKTTVINLLKSRGFQTLPEAFESLYNKAKTENTIKDFFNDFVVLLSKVAHCGVKQEEMLDDSREAFLDRSALEPIFYAQHLGVILPDAIISKIKQQNYNKTVFFLDALPEKYYEQTAVRTESREEALKLHTHLKKCYEEHGFSIVSIPFESPEKRVELILNCVEGDIKT